MNFIFHRAKQLQYFIRMSETKHFVEVALPLPVRKTFTYETPEEFESEAAPGKRVLVPFGRRFLTGFIMGPARKVPPGAKILPLRQVLEGDVSISGSLLKFLSWVSAYYLQPIGEVLRTAIPAGTQLASRETYFLTEKGREEMARLPDDSADWKILQALKERGEKGSAFSSLSRKIPSPLRPVLEKLEEKGWIEKREVIHEARVRGKTAGWVRTVGHREKPDLPPREKEVLDCIREAGEIPIAELKKRAPACASILPRLRDRGLAEVFLKEVFREPSLEEIENWADGPPAILNDDQNKALLEITASIDSGKFQPFLLHGVTGSGKTEVYLRAIQEALSRNRQALLMVPEIALTSQLVAYFRFRISQPMAVLHSGLSPGERYDEWRRVKKGLANLVIGARSSIFAPLDSLGIIIVDEEHDPSYKQEEKVRYHARDLALVRGKMENAVVVLGSATPSLESYYNAVQKKFRLLPLPFRVDQKPLPEIEVRDMRLETGEGKERPVFSRSLEEAIGRNGERKEQALLFLNRRGFSSFALCLDCGFTYKCPNCSVSLTYHLPDKTFRCHYCDHALSGLDRCPECGGGGLRLFGVGTQRLEEEIKKKFPRIRVGRMDRDTTSGKASHQRILGRVRRGEVNLLIGTQMITKGHDLPRVTLVGVLAADLSLNVPDFRAGERTFQLLTQVAGRAGRGSLPGKVIIQTYNPGHYSIRMAQAQDYLAFYEQETFFRKEMSYPPFVRLINFRLEANSEARLMRYARELEDLARLVLREDKKNGDEVEALGPSMAPLARLRGKFRCQMLFKGKKWSSLHDFAEGLLRRAEAEVRVPGVKLIIDVDPVHML